LFLTDNKLLKDQNHVHSLINAGIALTGQKPMVIMNKKSNASFNVKKHAKNCFSDDTKK